MRPLPIAQLFRALSDTTRLRILHLLRRESDLCVGDLVAILRVPQPTASRHLRYLRRCHLVDVRRDGRWGFYSVAATARDRHGRLLDGLDECLDEMPEARRDLVRLRDVLEGGGCCPNERGRRRRGSGRRSGAKPVR